ncbi:MAG: hypothetical protein VKL59_14280 [Nostocaceae cyanobacterium]|nr:hypothetical protein [Nostocaceae cyanobacterium]
MSFKTFPSNLPNLRPLLTLIAIIWVLGLLGFGWLLKSFLILLLLLLLAPVVAFFGFRWWLRSNLVTEACPVCGYELTGLNNTQLQCPNCGEQLTWENHHLQRLTPPGTIEVQAVEVPTQVVEE